MLTNRPLQIALFTLSLTCFAASAWLKSYIVDHQGAWGGRANVIRIKLFGDFVAPPTIGYSYFAACLGGIFFISVVAVLSAKRK